MKQPMMKLYVLVSLMLIGGGMVVGQSKDTISKIFKINPAEPVDLVFKDTDGHLVVETHDSDKIEFLFLKKLKVKLAEQNMKFFTGIYPEFVHKSNSLKIEVAYPGKDVSDFSASFFSHIECGSRITVPRNTNVRVVLNQGDIDIEGIRGTLHLESVEGNIRVAGCVGNMDVRTAKRNIKISGAEGEISVVNGDGNIVLENFKGPVKLETVNGDITATKGTGTLNVVTTEGQVKAVGTFSQINYRGGDGPADFILLPDSVLQKNCTFQSVDGDIGIVFPTKMSLKVEVKTRKGGISFPNVKFNTTTVKKKNQLKATKGIATYGMSIKTKDGYVSLKEQDVPKN